MKHQSFGGENDDAVNAIYSPNIVCFRKSQSTQDTINHRYELCHPFMFSVLSIAGFDLRQWDVVACFFKKGTEEFDWDLFEKAMTELYDLTFRIAISKGHSHIVAVPVNCGSFSYPGKDKETFERVGKAFCAAVKKYQGNVAEVSMVAINHKVALVFQEIMSKEGLIQQ